MNNATESNAENANWRSNSNNNNNSGNTRVTTTEAAAPVQEKRGLLTESTKHFFRTHNCECTEREKKNAAIFLHYFHGSSSLLVAIRTRKSSLFFHCCCFVSVCASLRTHKLQFVFGTNIFRIIIIPFALICCSCWSCCCCCWCAFFSLCLGCSIEWNLETITCTAI